MQQLPSFKIYLGILEKSSTTLLFVDCQELDHLRGLQHNTTCHAWKPTLIGLTSHRHITQTTRRHEPFEMWINPLPNRRLIYEAATCICRYYQLPALRMQDALY